MEHNAINILSTRPLREEIIADAKDAGIQIDEISFITTEPIQTIEVYEEIEQALLQSAVVIFTSMNAVEAVAAVMNEVQPEWTIYCIGNSTKRLVQEYFGENSIAGTAGSAAELAELIAEEMPDEMVIFFCGDQRRDELPAILEQNNIKIQEIVVYQTIPLQHVIKKKYAGILFFSPSAVASFFKTNNVTHPTILFAIGSTTAGEIKKYTTNKIIISDEPGKENLVNTAIDFFTA